MAAQTATHKKPSHEWKPACSMSPAAQTLCYPERYMHIP